MLIKFNEKTYKVSFKYEEHKRSILVRHDKNHYHRSIVYNGMEQTVSAILYNLTDDYEIMREVAVCEIFDKYDKRFGMNLAIKYLLNSLKISSDIENDITFEFLHQIIKLTFFNYKKNVKYKYLIESNV